MLAPIRRLYLKKVAAVADALFSSQLLERIVCLGIDRQKLNDHHVALLAESPHLSRLGCLDLTGNDVTTAGLECLMRSKGLPISEQQRTFAISQLLPAVDAKNVVALEESY